MPVPSSLEVLDPAYAKTIRIIIVRLERRCSQSRDHSAILKLSPRSNRANNSARFSIHDSFELWWCEKLAIFFRDRKRITEIIASFFNVEEVMEIVEGLFGKSEQGTFTNDSVLLCMRPRFHISVYICANSFFFLFFSPLVMFEQLFLYYCNEVIV